MKICGVIAEYNPFHNGHAFQLAETRRILGADTAMVCMMSGNFVQRGDFALLDKYARAKAAVQGGADLVLELPLGAVLSSAEGFARGAVGALHALGQVGYLSFGSEGATAKALMHAAGLIDTGGVARARQQLLQEGLSYAAAQQKALAQVDETAGQLLDTPNNILGLEYCRAIAAWDGLISPIAICRRGVAHDSAGAVQGFASAAQLRAYVAADDAQACLAYMPQESYAILQEEMQRGAAPVYTHAQAMLSHLRRMDVQAFARYERVQEGLPYRLQQAVWQAGSYQQACTQAQTRRYPLARIRRAYLRAYLDVPLESTQQAPQYLRVLAIGAQGRALLRQFAKTASIPLITKPLHEKQLPAHAQIVAQGEAMADELYALAKPEASLRCGGTHYRGTPYCVQA